MATPVQVVLYKQSDPANRIILFTVPSLLEARRIAKLFCGKGWVMERRPGLHSFALHSDNVFVTYEYVKES